MDRNPYSELPLPSSEPRSAAATASGNLHGLFDAAWERFKADWLGLSAAAAAFLVLIVALSAGADSVYRLGASALGIDPEWMRVFFDRPDAVDPTMLAKTLALTIAHNLGNSALVSAATFWIYPCFLDVARGRPPSFAPISAAFGRLPHIVAVLYAVAVLTSAGSFLCLVPGWIAAFSLILSGYVAADTNLGVVDSLRYAWRLMVGHRVQYFGVSLLAGFAGGLGALLTCGLGILPLFAVTFLMSAIAYVRLSGRVTAGMPDPSL